VQDVGFGTRFGIASLATWRLTHLLAREDGPADLVVRARLRLRRSRAGELMDCFYCLSIWVAGPVAAAVAPRRRELPLVWLALSGAACLLEQATTDSAAAQQGGSAVMPEGCANPVHAARF
jgi:hypothetical protein